MLWKERTRGAAVGIGTSAGLGDSDAVRIGGKVQLDVSSSEGSPDKNFVEEDEEVELVSSFLAEEACKARAD